MVKPFGGRAPPPTPLVELTALFFTTYFLQQVLCRFIQSTDNDCILLCLVATRNYCGPNVFDTWLQTMTESTQKILKLDWKTPRIFSSRRVGTLPGGRLPFLSARSLCYLPNCRTL